MFFSNQRYGSNENKSSIQAYSSFYKKEGKKIDSEYDFRLRFDLPRTLKKLKVVIEKEQDEIGKVMNGPSAQSSAEKSRRGGTSSSQTRYLAGLSYFLKKNKYFSSTINFGIRLDLPINPYVKLHLKKNIRLKYLNIDLSQEFMFYRQEGLQEISQVSFNRKWNNIIQTSLINSMAWSDETDIFILRNNFVLYQKLKEERGLSYSLGANAKLSPTFYYDSYDASVGYRQLLYNKWLYGELVLGMDFLKENNFRAEKFIQIKLELYFKE